MGNLVRTVGSLNNLLAFEAAARHGNFTYAARELLVTQPAISRRIKQLEQSLNTKLFRRHGTRLVLSRAGLVLLDSVQASFTRLEATARHLSGDATRGSVTMGVSIAGSLWLLPALGEFYAENPDIQVNLVCGDEVGEAERRFDLEVRFGVGDWAGESHTLLPEEVFPVASQAFLAKHRITTLADCFNVPLLQLGGSISPLMDWKSWLDFKSHHHLAYEMHSFTDYAILLEAAILGHGLALGWKYYAANAVQRGQLVSVADVRRSSDYAEYLIVNRRKRTNAAVSRVAEWTIRYAEQTRQRYAAI